MHGPPPQAGAAKWYSFEVAGVCFFMMDTRFERGFAPDGGAPPLCSDAQLAALGNWLETVERERPGAPKFIVSGSVYAPGLAEWDGLPTDRVRGDNWQGFATERAAIARRIAQARADNVVFLSGDYHCAAVSAIQWIDAADRVPLQLRAWSIVSPPLYAPFPFANSRAENVLLHEAIRLPRAAATVPPLAHCQARAFDRAGFALIRVTHGGGLPVELEVEFVDPSARDPGQGSRLERLSRLRVEHPAGVSRQGPGPGR
jgi:alkaline phosphatase D